MGTLVSKPKTLLPDKFKVLVKTNIKLPKKGKYIKEISDTIENMSAAIRTSISHYLNIKSQKITNLNPFSFELVCVLNKNGKKIKSVCGEKLKKEEITNLLTFENLEEHIKTSLDEQSFRGYPFKIGNNKEFVIKKSNIDTIKLITK